MIAIPSLISIITVVDYSRSLVVVGLSRLDNIMASLVPCVRVCLHKQADLFDEWFAIWVPTSGHWPALLKLNRNVRVGENCHSLEMFPSILFLGSHRQSQIA